MSDHSIFGPSQADRWLNCPGSIAACAKLPEPPESPYAAEGTMAHTLAEISLRNNSPCSMWKNFTLTKHPDTIVPIEMPEYVQQYVDYVRALGGSQEYEQQISYEEWVPGGYGTADAIVVNHDIIHVIDLKYGKGVPVDAYENPQGKLYALGALSERDSFQAFNEVVITIHQPRLESISVFKTTPNELYQWSDDVVRPAAKRCLEPNAPLIPGTKQCRWCIAKPTCPALMRSVEETLLREFDEMDDHLDVISFLDDQQLRLVLENKPLIIDWLNSVEKHVTDRIMAGEKFAGYKIVHGRSNRKWADEAKAEQVLLGWLGDKAYTKKLISVPQAEKALGKTGHSGIKDLIVKPAGAPVLVPDTDKRKEVDTITADDFD